MKTYFVKSYNVNYPVLDLEVQVDSSVLAQSLQNYFD